VKSASGSGAWERVQLEMGSQIGRTSGGSGNGCRGSIATLGEGTPLNPNRQGVAKKQGGTGAGDGSVEAAGLGGGLPEGTGSSGGLGVGGGKESTLGGS
jgi:hypothetical protein